MISILLLSLYLVSTTEVYQFLKIPTLIEHYWEHKRMNPEMSVTAFLKIHYDHPVKDGDYGKDQKLPFVIHSTPLNLVFTINRGFYFETAIYHLNSLKSHKIPSKNEDFSYKGFAGPIWEPPKLLSI
ncbi:hypothetical protein CHRY9393_00805 [Chryseobacterium fistulae]|uniref:Uncharacterized protein n=1 Tax=Chryseobacterium fistulae TaxID=2675058 RepID=A0A6N4XSD2_9FLAO|nr:hypothetical protein CHRY9393_00805 [Chryseobacterium fistulae]